MLVGQRCVVGVPVTQRSTARQRAEMKLVRVLEVLHDQEGRAAQERNRQEADGLALLRQLRRADAKRHRQRRKDQDHGVDRAQLPVEQLVNGLEHLGVGIAVRGVRHKQTRKQQDFSRQKDPHPELGRFRLVACRGEVVRVMIGTGRIAHKCSLRLAEV